MCEEFRQLGEFIQNLLENIGLCGIKAALQGNSNLQFCQANDRSVNGASVKSGPAWPDHCELNYFPQHEVDFLKAGALLLTRLPRRRVFKSVQSHGPDNTAAATTAVFAEGPPPLLFSFLSSCACL